MLLQKQINIRKAEITDLEKITHLFRETVLHINSKDYSQSQVEIWSSGADNTEKWKQRIEQQYFILAQMENQIVGFASISPDGYLDVFYVHKDFQKQGVAKALLKEIEKQAKIQKNKEITSEISITALPFFEKNGFKVVKEQRKELKGTIFINYLMVKYKSD